jgi:hypothetical protein
VDVGKGVSLITSYSILRSLGKFRARLHINGLKLCLKSSYVVHIRLRQLLEADLITSFDSEFLRLGLKLLLKLLDSLVSGSFSVFMGVYKHLETAHITFKRLNFEVVLSLV